MACFGGLVPDTSFYEAEQNTEGFSKADWPEFSGKFAPGALPAVGIDALAGHKTHSDS